MAVRMAVKVQAKDKQYKGVHRQVEHDLHRSELLPFILMACYSLNHAAMYILMLLTMSLLDKACKVKLDWQVLGGYIIVTLIGIASQ